MAEYYQRLRAFRFAFRIVLDSTTVDAHMAAAQEMAVAISLCGMKRAGRVSQ